MDQSVVVPKKCILKVDIHCNECEREIKRALSKVDGVYSVSVDGKAGMVTVTGNMDPYKVIKALKKKGKQAMILQYEDAVPVQPTASVNASQQGITGQMAHLHHFSNMEKLKQVEFTHDSKSLRMTFQSHQNGGVGSSCWVASGYSQPPAMNYNNTNRYSCTTPRGSCHGDMSLPSSCSIPPHAPRQQHNHLIPNAPTSPYLNAFADDLPTNCNLM